MKREDGFYWIGNKNKELDCVVAYYEHGWWIFCGSHYFFSDEDLEKDGLNVLDKLIQPTIVPEPTESQIEYNKAVEEFKSKLIDKQTKQ